MRSISTDDLIKNTSFVADESIVDEGETIVTETSYVAPPSTYPSPMTLFRRNEEAELELDFIKTLQDEAASKDTQVSENMKIMRINQLFAKNQSKSIDDKMRLIAEKGGDLQKVNTVKNIGLATSAVLTVATVIMYLVTGVVGVTLSMVAGGVNAATGGLAAYDQHLKNQHKERLGLLQVSKENRAHHNTQFQHILDDNRKETEAKALVMKKFRLILALQQNIKME